MLSVLFQNLKIVRSLPRISIVGLPCQRAIRGPFRPRRLLDMASLTMFSGV